MHARRPTQSSPAGNIATRAEITAAQASIVVKAPVAIVYQRWLRLEDYPKFISVIKRVRKLDDSHFSAWIEFNEEKHDALLEIMLRVPERRVAWRTISNRHSGDHLGAGVVSFAPQPNGSTHLTLKMTSSFGGALSQRVENYLQVFKGLIEAKV